MTLKMIRNLKIDCLSQLFDRTTESYKFFWFLAILEKVSKDKDVLTYNELINQMVAEAWFMVSQNHLNFGKSDAIEEIIKRINEIEELSPLEGKDNILAYLFDCEDKEVLKYKKTLTQMVPYRLQTPFLKNIKKDSLKVRPEQLAKLMNEEEGLIYYYEKIDGLDSIIRVQPEWMEYLKSHKEILKGWTYFNLTKYLERKNPNVCGISDKLFYDKKSRQIIFNGRKIDKFKEA